MPHPPSKFCCPALQKKSNQWDMMFYILYMVHLYIMIRIDTYDYIITKLTNTIFPTAVLVGFQSVGLGLVHHGCKTPKTRTEQQNPGRSWKNPFHCWVAKLVEYVMHRRVNILYFNNYYGLMQCNINFYVIININVYMIKYIS